MKLYICEVVLVVLFPAVCFSQWSHDPSENLQLLIGSLDPKMISDDDGGAIVVGTSFTTRPHQFAQRVDRDGNILWDTSLLGIQVSTAGDQQALIGSLEKSPQVISDGDGGVYVAFNAWWVVGQLAEPPEEIYTVRAYLQRIDKDGNRLFGQEGIPLLFRAPVDTSFQALVALVEDGAGGAYVVFEDRLGPQDGKYINRIDGLGNKFWGDGLKLFEGTSDPDLISYPDGAGGLCIYARMTFSDRFFRINGNGEITLNREIEIGVPPSGFSPFYDFVSQDGEGMFVWQDFDSDTLRVQKIDTEGNTLWGNEPVVLDLKWPHNVFFRVTPNQNGGMFVFYPSSEGGKLKLINSNGNIAWEKKTGGNGLIFDGEGGVILSIPASGTFLLQRFDAAGNPLWSSEGVLYTTRRPEAVLGLISDGNQGAILTWCEIVPGRGTWMQQVNKDGSLGVITSVESTSLIDAPVNFVLYQNYPNPFNAQTRIEYEVTRASEVNLSIIDILGKEVIMLVNEKQQPGRYLVFWNGKNKKGGDTSSGAYFCQLKSGDEVHVRKLMLLR